MGTTGLVIGFYLPGKYEALAGVPPKDPTPLNAWVQIATDDSAKLLIDKWEMGQEISTALKMILADDLDLSLLRPRRGISTRLLAFKGLVAARVFADRENRLPKRAWLRGKC